MKPQYCVLGWAEVGGGKMQRIIFSPDPTGRVATELAGKPVTEGDSVDDLYTLSLLTVRGWDIICDTGGRWRWYFFKRHEE